MKALKKMLLGIACLIVSFMGLFAAQDGMNFDFGIPVFLVFGILGLFLCIVGFLDDRIPEKRAEKDEKDA